MSNNLIIGLGGTGAKIVESFIHLCAAGLGPAEASVAFVDQDQANGNTMRASNTLRDYMAARSVLRHDDLSNSLSDRTGFLKTVLTPLQSQNRDEDLQTGREALRDAFWVPHGEGQTLSQIIDYANLRGGSKLLADVFFDNSETELDMVLDAGYQGRPHVGAAALLAELNEDKTRWKAALDEMIGRASSHPVRIFLCASAFGGTGAAALPTLAREIRRKAANGQDVAVSAALMLPYYDFAEPNADQDANVAQSPYLRQQTRAALDYYKRLLSSEGLFKNIYLLGWDPLFSLGYHEKGQQGQVNPSLVPELYAAMAAADALRGTVSNPVDNKVLAIGRSDRDQVSWDDIPREIAGEKTQEAYARLLRMAAMWMFSCREGISHERRARLHFGKEAWYKRYFPPSFAKDADAHEKLKPIDDYVEQFLRYAAFMAGRSQVNGIEDYFKMWRSAPIATVERNGDPRAGFTLKKQFKDREQDALEDLLCGARDQVTALSYTDVTERLAHYPKAKTERGKRPKGLVPFIDALWNVCAVQSSESGGPS